MPPALCRKHLASVLFTPEQVKQPSVNKEKAPTRRAPLSIQSGWRESDVNQHATGMRLTNVDRVSPHIASVDRFAFDRVRRDKEPIQVALRHLKPSLVGVPH